MDEYTVYGILDPDKGQVRYVGITKNPVQRFKQHLRNADWIQDLLQRGIQPQFEILEQIDTLIEARHAEKRWIKHFEAQGCSLENWNHNVDARTKRSEIADWEARDAQALARLTNEQRKRLDELHAEGVSRFGDRYWSFFWDVWRTANGPYMMDADLHRIELAEIALKFCEIPTRREEES